MRRQKEVNISVLGSRKQWLCRQAAEGVQLIAELPPPQRPFLAEA